MLKKKLSFLFIGLFAVISIAASSMTVTFNTKTFKYHTTNCPAAIRCTKSCIDIPIDEAIQKGGIPCKKCHPHK